MRGGRGWFFCPPPTASHACQPCLVPLCRKKKKKKIKKVQKVIQGCKILVPVGTRIKNSSAGWHCFEKLKCLLALCFGLFKTFFFMWLFQLASFGHAIWNVHGQKNFFLPFQKYFWHAWVRYNPMYVCIFKLTRTRSVKTSISDNFLVCGPIWVHDASFWSYWSKDSFKIILVSIERPEKNKTETLEMHEFQCWNT